jgi:alpha-N-arabinofuranosidase
MKRVKAAVIFKNIFLVLLTVVVAALSLALTGVLLLSVVLSTGKLDSGANVEAADVAIMDRYDPEKKIGMVVDEWGTWYQVEPGTNPRFLYQQNTLRDALVAGITLNIFNKHSDRVRVACLAQTVNVLQAVILTEGERMLRTPTYHVMRMYRHHQGAEMLESNLTNVKTVGGEDYPAPMLHESVSVDAEGILTVTLVNLSTDEPEQVALKLQEEGYRVLEAKILCAEEIGSYNTFDEPDLVSEKDFEGVKTDGGISFTLPAASVVALRLKK